jgi:hypothetical protein
MENEKMIVVLTEMLEEQKELSRSQSEVIEMIQTILVKLDGVIGMIKDKEDNTPKVDLKPIQQMVDGGVSEIKLWIEMLLQKGLLNNLRIFLESDAKKWADYLLVSLTLLTYLYLLLHK